MVAHRPACSLSPTIVHRETGMLVCPSDLAWCNRQECRSGICELTAEPPFVPCAACGVLVVRAVANGFCVECIAVEAIDRQEGG